MNELERRVADEIERRGPVPFSEVMDLALYDPALGFYATGGAAGRRGDFITSPEVGPLFGAVNSVIALFYYARVAQAMWMQPVPDDDRTPIHIPPALLGALAICTIAVVVVGFYPQLVARVGDMAQFALG